MKQQQRINNYVDILKKYEKRKRTKQSLRFHQLQEGHHQAHTLEPAFFKQNVQERIKNKMKQHKNIPISAHTNINILELNREEDSEMKITKRKFEAYRQSIERKYTLEKQEESLLEASNLRSRQKINLLFQNKNLLFQPHKIEHKTTFRNIQIVQKKNANNYHEIKSANKCQPIKKGNKLANLEGGIFHFQKNSELFKPGSSLYRNMFRIKDHANQKVAIYELLKAISPITVKSKEAKDSERDLATFSKITQKDQLMNGQNIMKPTKSLTKSKIFSHKKERSSLINLRIATQTLTGWEMTDCI